MCRVSGSLSNVYTKFFVAFICRTNTTFIEHLSRLIHKSCTLLYTMHTTLHDTIFRHFSMHIELIIWEPINYSINNKRCLFALQMIMDLISNVRAGWVDLMENKSDPRTSNWPLMSSPFPTLFMCLTYVYIVKVNIWSDDNLICAEFSRLSDIISETGCLRAKKNRAIAINLLQDD